MNAKTPWVLALAGLIGTTCAAYSQPGAPPPPPQPYTQGPPPGAGMEPGDQGGPGYGQPAGPDQPPPYGSPDQPPPNGGPDQPPPYGSPDQPPPPGGAQGYGQPPADREQADVGQFYNQLSPYGEWEQAPNYGWVWTPRGVAAGWRPYTEGHWVYSDAGWAWVSDEPFGWATYHYGRWFDDPGLGWAWVPGPVWAPAWVTWRSGGGYIGWAPLPPAVGWRAGFGLELGGLDLNVAIRPGYFSFVGERDFLSGRVRDVLIPHGRNVTIIRNTTNITNYTVVNNRVINRGVPIERVEQVVGHRVEPVRLASVSTLARAGERGGAVAFYRPPVARVAGRAALDVRPPVRQAPGYSAEELGRRHQTEQRDLEQYQQGQRQRLQDIHQRELAGQQTQAGRDQLSRQHAEEMQAQQQLHQRQTQVLQSRQQRERESSAPHHPPH